VYGMKKLLVVGCALFVLTGCRPYPTLPRAAKRQTVAAPSYSAVATCSTLTITLAGYPEDTLYSLGVDSEPPYGLNPGTSLNGSHDYVIETFGHPSYQYNLTLYRPTNETVFRTGNVIVDC
jgi:hypothetical protein